MRPSRPRWPGSSGWPQPSDAPSRWPGSPPEPLPKSLPLAPARERGRYRPKKRPSSARGWRSCAKKLWLRRLTGKPGPLVSRGPLHERPFTSDVPLLGPLIARFRTAWNNVASRWYLGHLMSQQNEFNRLAVAEMSRLEQELREQMALLEEQIVAGVGLREEIDRLQARLAELAALMPLSS